MPRVRRLALTVALPLLGLLFLGAASALAQSGDFGDAVHVEQVAPSADAHSRTNASAPERVPDLDGGPVRSLVPASETGVFVVQDGRANETSVAQSGRGHRAVVVQRGVANETRLRQTGTGHRADLRLDGVRNRIAVRQAGTGNRYRLDFEGRGLNRDASHRVVQRGSDLRAVQVGAGTMPYSIRQRGNGMRLRIEHRAP